MTLKRASKILVTGASGFLGAEICRQLQDTGYTVVGTGRDATRLKLAPAEKSVAGDLLELDLHSLLHGVDGLVHCAALSSPWGSAPAFHRANVDATRLLLEAAEKNSIQRFVHISTPAIYFNGRDRLNLTEDSPLPARQANAYTETKLAAERILLSQDKVPVIILRPRAIFGPGDRTLFPRLAKAAQAGKLRIFGTGETLCDLTDVQNAALAAVVALEASPSCLGQAYNITNDEPVLLWEVITRLLRETGLPEPRRRFPEAIVNGFAAFSEGSALLSRREPLLTRYTAGLLMHSQTFDISKAKADLGYAPAIAMEPALQRFAHWLKTEWKQR